MNSHPITPPSHDLVTEWEDKYHGHMPEWVLRHVATEAARWGADQELEACRLWVSEVHSIYDAAELLNQRRPKPPSLKQQALDVLGGLEKRCDLQCNLAAIRRALEQLDE